jgi:hypothetical protein
MRGVKGSGKAKPLSQIRVINENTKGKRRKEKSTEVGMALSKVGNLTEPMTVSVGARATIRVGDHEFLSPDITFHNLDPQKDLDKQIAEGIKVIDKAWATIIKQMHLKMESFISEVQG